MTLYIENSKDTTKKLLEPTNEFSKTARQKHTEIYFSTLTMNFQNKNLRIPFTTASKRIRYPAINLTKEIKGHYSENCETVREKTEDDTNRWNYTVFMDWKNTVKVTTVSKAIYTFSVFLIKIPMAFLVLEFSRPEYWSG